MRSGKPATIRDVARAAQVSPTTVSRYLNGSLALPADTIRRINDAVKHLKYQPNGVARNLSLGRSKTLGLIIPDVANPFFAILASEVEQKAYEAGYSLTLCNTQNDANREVFYLNLLRSRQVDGLLFLPSRGENLELQQDLSESQHVVLVDEDVNNLQVPKVFPENRRGGFLATKHLLDAGHRHIGHVGGLQDLLSARERFAGYLDAYQSIHTTPAENLMIFGPYSTEFGKDAASTLFAQNPKPSAIFAASDHVLVGVLEVVADLGLAIPHDLSVVGFDDMPLARLLNPPLTTVRQPIRGLGAKGLELLLGRIHDASTPNETIRLPVELIERSSVTTLDRA